MDGGRRRGEAVRERQRVVDAVADRERFRQRRLLRQERDDGLIDRVVAIDAVAAADEQRRSGNRAPRHTHARLQSPPIGTDQAVIGDDGRHGCEAGRDTQIHQPAEPLRRRRLIFPSRPNLHRPGRAEPPVVGEIGVRAAGAEILVGVAKGDRTGAGNAEQEVRQIGSSQRAGEREHAARIQLRAHVGRDVPHITPKREVVTAASPVGLHARVLRLAARVRGQRVAQAGHGRELQRGRSPVLRILIVACDAGLARHVDAIGEVRRRAVRHADELITKAHRQRPIDAMHPADRCVDAGHPACVLEAEERRLIGGDVLIREQPDELIVDAERLRHACGQEALRGAGDERTLIVEAAPVEDGRQGIKAKQRPRLRADAAVRNDRALEWLARARVDDLYWLPRGGEAVREVARALTLRRHHTCDASSHCDRGHVERTRKAADPSGASEKT